MLEIKTARFPRVTPCNVGSDERWTTFGSGLLMVFLALWRKSLSSLLLLPAGLYLLYRSVSGHCYVYDYLGISTLRPAEPDEEVPPTGVGPYDEVAESSWESFPTSDAPAWTMGKRD